MSSWIRGTPMFEEYWGPGIQTLRSTEAILNSERRLREEVRSIVFSPDGRLLVSTHQEGIVEFWNATTGQHQQTVQTHSTCIRCTDLSEKGAVLAIGSQDGSIELWNTDTVAFEDGRLGVCDLTTGTQQYITRGDRTPHSLAFAAGGGLLISVDSYSVGRYTVEVFDAASMELLDLFESKRAQISWPQLSSDGRFLAFLAEGYIDIRSVKAKVLCGRLATRGDTGQIVFSRDCSMLAFNTSASKISLWNLNNGSTYEIDHGHPDRPEALAFSPNSRLLVSGYRNILKLWDLSIDQIQHASRPRYHVARWIVPSPNGELLASGSEEGRVRLWNPRTGECTAILGRHKHMCTLYFSPCGNRIATGGKDSLVKLWNIHTRNLEASWDQNSEVVSIRFSPRGDILASNCSGGLIDLWELGHDEPKPLPQIQSQAGNDIAFVANGRLLVRSEENSIGLYNPRTSQSIRLIEIPEWRSLLIRSMMLSPDGRRVAFELDDNTIRVWDAKDAQFERTFTGTHAAWASRIALIHVYEREWLCVNGEKILWLPPQQRAAALAYKKGTLVIVHESGRFSMILCLI
ncbi:WD40 repeat-like protein [Aspergillus japonicus CBS 114.51]|uniref:WD40 repeat-like protein n=1 Tax=Aspergillus japonicus CBS 114.51 TaxID=1448312 RepID=A0A8T8XEY9_ASPJA|nr:WD40 repeat-like protein [Aspergillus japonicus CBS 114.51]RAH86846.1 WD40 repeat-like protein [Aspergillus japonicus CBS 114.51]